MKVQSIGSFPTKSRNVDPSLLLLLLTTLDPLAYSQFQLISFH